MRYLNGQPTRILNARECRLIQTVGQRLIPEGGGIAFSARDVPLVEFTDRFMADLPVPARIGFRLAFWLVEWLPLMRFRGRFTHLDEARQDAFLEWLRMHPSYGLHSLYILLNTSFQMCFYADPRVMAAIGYLGDQPGQNKVPSPSRAA